MEKYYIIYDHCNKEYYRGLKNYEWTEHVTSAKEYNSRPKLAPIFKKSKGHRVLEIKIIYTLKK